MRWAQTKKITTANIQTGEWLTHGRSVTRINTLNLCSDQPITHIAQPPTTISTRYSWTQHAHLTHSSHLLMAQSVLVSIRQQNFRLQFWLAEIMCSGLNGDFFSCEQRGQIERILVGKFFDAEWIFDWWRRGSILAAIGGLFAVALSSWEWANSGYEIGLGRTTACAAESSSHHCIDNK